MIQPQPSRGCLATTVQNATDDELINCMIGRRQWAV